MTTINGNTIAKIGGVLFFIILFYVYGLPSARHRISDEHYKVLSYIFVDQVISRQEYEKH